MKDKKRPEIPAEAIIEVNSANPLDFSKPYQYIYFQWWFEVVALPFYMVCYTAARISSVFLGLTLVDRKKVKATMKNQGCIMVSNHCHYFDTVLASVIQFPRKLYVSVAQRNFEVPVARRILRLTYAFPIPSRRTGLKMITKSIGKALSMKRHVLFLPEGELVHLSQTIYRFRLGGFQQAYYHQAPIIPQVYVLKRRKLFGKEMGPNWITMTCVYGNPIMPPPFTEDAKVPKEELQKIADQVADWMENTIAEYHKD